MEIEIITEPKVILATCTELNPNEDLAEYTDDYPFVESLDSVPELAGRICYQSFNNPRPGGNKSYLKRILQEGHGNVAEHAYVGFIITGVSRALSHELIRHRAGTGVSQLSQRYCDHVRFVMPPKALEDQYMYDTMVKSFRHSMIAYRALVELGLDSEASRIAAQAGHGAGVGQITTLMRKRAREAARAVLPNAVETQLIFTANLRAWRNILEQRGSIHADLEIRRLACVLAVKLKEVAPNWFGDVEVFPDSDGIDSVSVLWRKV